MHLCPECPSTRWRAISQRVTNGNNGVPIFSLDAVPGCTQLITMPQTLPCLLHSGISILDTAGPPAVLTWTQQDHWRSSPEHSGTTCGPHLDTTGPLAVLTWTQRDHWRSSPGHSTVFILPEFSRVLGGGLINNTGIGTVWHHCTPI